MTILILILKTSSFIILVLDGSSCWTALEEITRDFYMVITMNDIDKNLSYGPISSLVSAEIPKTAWVYFGRLIYIYRARVKYKPTTFEGGLFISILLSTAKGIYGSSCSNSRNQVGDYVISSKLCVKTGNYAHMWTKDLFSLDDILFFGYVVDFKNFLGCFANKYLNLSDPMPNEYCDVSCDEVPLYGYNFDEECLCVLSTPNIFTDRESCHECSNRVGILCGDENHTAVYATTGLQEDVEYDIENEDKQFFIECLTYETCDRKKCPGRQEIACSILDCETENGQCGSKECGYQNSFFAKEKYSSCFCRDGYFLTPLDLECHDVVECDFDDLCAIYDGTCINVDGSYFCQCGAGFNQLDERRCEDIDECEFPESCNLEISTCVNYFGYYDCNCFEGYTKKEGVQPGFSCLGSHLDGYFLLFLLLSSMLLIIILVAAVYYYKHRKKH